MEFFIPQVGAAEAESVYETLATMAGGSPEGPRIRAIEWMHDDCMHRCAVGEPLPGVHGSRTEPVLAIIKVSRPTATYKLCTAGDEFEVPAEACQKLELFSRVATAAKHLPTIPDDMKSRPGSKLPD